ncbi:cytochrome b/b6 domain-containing protein [Desulfitibacter alkalitolerans]|uniref:cytochrome b/b6 domain-containing protein n=1 Tax=Desulfitibacter alkalitolerans TaxID=264641 RepID=UPI000489565A|nr:cytochrome b/b6 domain-containing protein [Desulfitibacter alkalitolerans]
MQKIMEQPLAIRIFHWSFVGATLIVLLTSFLKVFREYNFLNWPDTTTSFYHQTSGLLLFFLIIFRIYYSLISGMWTYDIPIKKEFASFLELSRYYAFLTEQKPPVFPKYNIAQKLTFLSWFFVVLIQTITGLILAFPEESKTIVSLVFGNLQMVRVIHFLTFAYFVITIIPHVYLVLVEDPAKLQAMFTGYLQRKE